MPRAGVGTRPRSSLGQGPRFLDAFSVLTPGASALPSGWLVSCATTNTTCRTSASTWTTIPDADTARIEDDGLGNVGVLVEPPTTNLLASLVSSGLPNLSGTVSYPGGDIAGPSGVAGTGERTTVSSGGFSRYDNPSLTTSIGCTLSGWYRAVTGTVVAQMNVSALATNHALAESVGTTWARLFRSTPNNYSLSGTGTIFVPVDARAVGSGTSAHPIDGYVASLQAEALPGPTSLIGPGLTRAGTRLYNPDLGRFVRNGRMRLEIGTSLLWDYTQVAAAGTLLQIDASNKIVLTPTTISTTPSGFAATITVDGNAYVCPTLIRAWRGDALAFYVEWGNGLSSLWFRIGSGPWILAGTSAASFASLASSGSLDLCCAGTSSQLPAIVAYARGW